MDGKASLRAELLDARIRRTAEDRERAGAALAQRALLEWREVSAVAAYAGVGPEPPTRALLDALRDRGTEVWLPIVTGRALHWATYEGWDRLVRGPLGLVEPMGDRSRLQLPDDVMLWLVPALAVDRTGVRLGRGGGYYDRALAGRGRGQRARTVAVVYDDELLDRLPREAHDVPVDAVLRPIGLLPLGQDAVPPD
jgi:5-formyltetrahydrofolate cyclo-ligase